MKNQKIEFGETTGMDSARYSIRSTDNGKWSVCFYASLSATIYLHFIKKKQLAEITKLYLFLGLKML